VMGYRHPDLMSAASANGIALSAEPDVGRKIGAAISALHDESDTAVVDSSAKPSP
jgi:hypothetical protein